MLSKNYLTVKTLKGEIVTVDWRKFPDCNITVSDAWTGERSTYDFSYEQRYNLIRLLEDK
jgi:hypothetical protein